MRIEDEVDRVSIGYEFFVFFFLFFSQLTQNTTVLGDALSIC